MIRRIIFISFMIGICCAGFFIYRSVTAPRVSVVMATYNRAHLLPRAIESVLRQTFSDFEFIIIDDGSTDETADVVRYFQNRDRRIVFLQNKKNKGLVASLNRGLAAARGRYIARIDDDDEMLRERLARQVAYFEEHPEATVLATGYYTYKYETRADGVKVRWRHHLGCPAPTEQVFVNMMRATGGVAHPTVMIDGAYLAARDIMYDPDFKSAEDYKLWYDILSTGGEIHCLQDPLIEYTRAGDNPSSFYREQNSNTRRIQVLFLSLLADNAVFLNEQHECEIFRELVKQNSVKRVVDQERLLNKIKENCPPDEVDSVLVEHPEWRDYVIFTDGGKRLYRFKKPKQTARVDLLPGGRLVVAWDEWAPETFLCDSAMTKCVLEGQNDAGTTKTN